MKRLPWLDPDPDAAFPPAAHALPEPEGLVAAGGCLSPTRLLNAYRNGIFPWFNPGEAILWWSPDPRMVFRTEGPALPARFRRHIRDSRWEVRADTAFDAVIAACAEVPRRGQRGTWIGPEMRRAYSTLHALGHAHSVEVYDGQRLIGGLYGVCIGRMVYAESMFSLESGASKVALGALLGRMRAWGWPLLDAQVDNPHLRLLGATTLPRQAFLDQAMALAHEEAPTGTWTGRFGVLPASALSRSFDAGPPP